MPISALFIIFDLVVHNPTHPETNNNLALLDVASGHFSRLEYASRGTLPGSLVAEFAHIARQYVRDVQLGEHNRNNHNNDGNVEIKNKTEAPNPNNVQAENQAQFQNHVQSQSQSQQFPNDVSSLSSAAAVFQTAAATTTAAAPVTPISLTTPQQQNQIFGGSSPQQAQHQQHYRSNSNSSSGNLMNDGTGAGAGAESLFFPLVDDPSYMPMPEELQLLGIDVMDLFDSVSVYPSAAAACST